MVKREVPWVAVILGIFFLPPLGLYFLVKKSETSRVAGLLSQIYGWSNVPMALLFFAMMIYPDTSYSSYTTPMSMRITFGVIGLIISGIAYLFIMIGTRNKKRILRCNKYVDYVRNHKLYSLDKIAELESTSYEAVLGDFKYIFEYDYLSEEAYLDTPNRVVVPKNVYQNSRVNIMSNQPNINSEELVNDIVSDAFSAVNSAFNNVNNTVNNTTTRTSTNTTTNTSDNTTTTNTTTSRTIYTNNPINGASVNRTKVVACGGCGASCKVTVGSTTECEYCGSPING